MNFSTSMRPNHDRMPRSDLLDAHGARGKQPQMPPVRTPAGEKRMLSNYQGELPLAYSPNGGQLLAAVDSTQLSDTGTRRYLPTVGRAGGPAFGRRSVGGVNHYKRDLWGTSTYQKANQDLSYSRSRPWTDEETQRLNAAVENFGSTHAWQRIAIEVGAHRAAGDCRRHWEDAQRSKSRCVCPLLRPHIFMAVHLYSRSRTCQFDVNPQAIGDGAVLATYSLRQLECITPFYSAAYAQTVVLARAPKLNCAGPPAISCFFEQEWVSANAVSRLSTSRTTCPRDQSLRGSAHESNTTHSRRIGRGLSPAIVAASTPSNTNHALPSVETDQTSWQVTACKRAGCSTRLRTRQIANLFVVLCLHGLLLIVRMLEQLVEYLHFTVVPTLRFRVRVHKHPLSRHVLR